MTSSRKYDDVITISHYFYKIKKLSWHSKYMPIFQSFWSLVQKITGVGKFSYPPPELRFTMAPCTRVKQPKQDKTDVTIHLVMRFPKFHEDYCYLSILSSVLITVYTVYTQTLLGGSQHKIFNYITINYQLSIINYQLSAINYDYYPSRGSQHKIFYYIIINEVLYYYQ